MSVKGLDDVPLFTATTVPVLSTSSPATVDVVPETVMETVKLFAVAVTALAEIE
jgi:hypothetical protein